VGRASRLGLVFDIVELERETQAAVFWRQLFFGDLIVGGTASTLTGFAVS
jgi:hypothetical protein